MRCQNNKTLFSKALTLVEMFISIAVITIILAVTLPVFIAIRNSWNSKAGAAETLQSGRFLIDHINRNLSKAVRINAVSDSAETYGFIEFQDNDANNLRYDVNSTTSHIQFGLIGDLSDLAGPVSKLQFTCYGAVDLSTPITDIDAIRKVKAETTLINQASLGQDMTFTTQAYIRTNALSSPLVISKLAEPWLEFDNIQGMECALCQIDQTHYLCAYRGPADKGLAVVLTVDIGTWNVSKETTFVYDDIGALRPALAKIDQTHYLCAFNTLDNRGVAVVLTVDPSTWNVSKGANFLYDNIRSIAPVLTQIDTSHYLCAYTSAQDDGVAVVLIVNTSNWNISKGNQFVYDGLRCIAPDLAQIDQTHYLCAYSGPQDDGVAVVLIVNTSTWDISKGTNFMYDDIGALRPALAKIDQTHYLCTFNTINDRGVAVVLTVDPSTWNISKGTNFLYDDIRSIGPVLAQIDTTHYLCAYTGPQDNGVAVVITVDTGTWDGSKETHFVYDANLAIRPDLAKIDDSHYLCAYTSSLDKGWAGVLKLGMLLQP